MIARNKIITSLACGVIALAMTTTGMANLIVNPGFEDEAAPGNPTGWTLNLSGGSAETSDDYAASGLQSLAINSAGAGEWASPNAFQSFAASAGETYRMGGLMLTPSAITDGSFGLFKIEFRDAGGTILEPAAVTIGTSAGAPFFGAESNFLDGNATPEVWISGLTEAVAPANTETVWFYALNVNPPGASALMYFDDVFAIPEPTSLALLGLGLLGLKGIRRRK